MATVFARVAGRSMVASLFHDTRGVGRPKLYNIVVAANSSHVQLGHSEGLLPNECKRGTHKGLAWERRYCPHFLAALRNSTVITLTLPSRVGACGKVEGRVLTGICARRLSHRTCYHRLPPSGPLGTDGKYPVNLPIFNFRDSAIA
jgi:hypothetical protein